MTPDAVDELFQRANQLLSEGRCLEAIALYEQVREHWPNHAEAVSNIGVAHADLGRHVEAIVHYDTAIRLKPTAAEAYFNRGNSLKELGRLADALSSYDTALGLRPDLASAWVNRGLALVRLGRLADAVVSYRRALQLRPDRPEGLNNLGLALQHLGRVEQAIDHFDAALRARPDWPDARTNRAQALLLKGDFRRGWPEYEWRWRLPRCQLPPRPMPQWDGSPLAGRSILLRAEQGSGDTLQFVRYAELVKQAGAGRVTLEAPARLHPLLQTCAGIDNFTVRENLDESSDVQIPLLSLPGVLRTDFRTIPRRVPYLAAEPERIERWKARLPEAGLRVGIAWQGSPGYPEDHLRSISLAAFEQLAKWPGVRLVSLQIGDGAGQIEALRERVPVAELGADLDADGAFLDTAAVMMSLDLVVTSDTSIAHLAGALGRPTWVA
ncbi:MAG: tetratricopeptide repeat protein, partial [Gemmataceae bacterium]